VTDGTYIGPRPVAPFPDDVVSAQEHALELRPAIDRHLLGLGRTLNRIFLVGAGGSLLGLVPAQYLLDKHAATPTVSMNSDEFYYRAPASVGPSTLVILLSGTGKTKETIRAAEWAIGRGATVAAVTLKEDGGLARSVPTAFVARTGHGSQIVLQLIALALLRREGFDTAPLHRALAALPSALMAALEGYEPRTQAIAAAMKDVPVTHVFASGPLFGAASTFTMCYLQEMQWMHAATINADEFFQGPFEVIDKQTRSIVFLGEDDTRPMGERVRRFLDAYGGETFSVDGKDFALPGVAQDRRAYLLPLVFHGLAARLAAHYSAVRGYALEGRRYMWKFDY
jgi:fructoselysine-6-P-deglycase FrlB-like protein